jgi:signal transduction histidine kinase
VRVAAGPGACLHVADEGPGLSAEALARLTRRHARADHASREGAGLGLNIVERIMAAHGGTLRSDAERRTLTLRFPYAVIRIGRLTFRLRRRHPVRLSSGRPDNRAPCRTRRFSAARPR